MAEFQPKSQIKWFSSRNEWFRTESQFAAGISPKISEKVIGKSPQFPYRKPMCYLNKSKIKTNSHLIFLPIGKLIRDDSTKTGYTVVKKTKIK